MSITPVIVDGLVSIEPTILENGNAYCYSSCPQFGYPDGNGTAYCCRLTETSDTTCEPYYQECIKKLEKEIERLKAHTAELEEINKSANSVIVKLSNQFLESQERLRRTAQILIEEVGADGPMNAEEAAEKAVDLIKNIKDDSVYWLSYKIEQGSHWPTEGEPKE